MSQLVLHIGDTIGILSDVHGYVTGRIIYYGPTLLRVLPREFSDRAVEFPMEEGGATFAPDLGVKLVELIDKQPSNYYVDVLGARPGETLEFFTNDGEEAAPSGVVEEVLKSTTKDSIKLTDGRVYKFRGIGPPEPIAVIRVLSAEAPQEPVESEDEDEKEKAKAATDVLALLRQVLPAATMEVVPTAERSYPDSMQREDLFQDLMAALTDKQKTNPRRIRMIEREVDLALSLKNKSIQRNAAGAILGPTPYSIRTVQEAVGNATAAIPIVQAARVLYLDNADPLSYKESDVVPRSLEATELESEELAMRYLDGALPETMGKGFAAYTYDLLGRGQAVLQGPAPTAWEDQDILRTAGPATAVQGLSKDLPPAGDDPVPISLAYLVSDVKDRMVRVLNGDPSVIIGHVILPPKAALALRPPSRPGHLPTALLYSASLESDNLPTLTQAIYDLYSAESGSPQHSWTLDADADAAAWLSSVLQYAVHPIDSLGPRGPRLLSLLDTLGLGATDLSPAVADVIGNWVSQSQAIWRSLLVERRKTIQAALDAEGPRTFQGLDAPLWANLKAADSLKEIYEDIIKKNPTIADAPTLVTASLLQEAQGDAAPLVWYEIMKMDARAESLDLQSAKDALAASRAYSLRRSEIRNAHLRMAASPEVNPCPHVNRLEAIRNIPDVLQRSRLLRDFIDEYQGSRRGDWATCALCSGDCVCYHELMELEALAQPTRMDSIQKQMLVKFGGDRYEGKIICRNCGQGLQELDYDDHVEFDDSGRPIITSSVLEEDPTETIVPQITFATQSQRDLSDVLQTIMDRGGLQINPDVIRQIVRYADIYVNVRSPKQADYDKQRTMLMMSAAKKAKKATGLTGGEDVPTYSALQDRLRVSALTALTAIAIQSADPPVIVNNPAPLCKFSREGYPFNPAAKPDEEGALLYMACVVASIERVTSPWNAVQWAGLANPTTRTTAVLKSALGAVQAILGESPLPFTPEVRLALTRAQTDLVAKRKKAQASLADQLPVGFRPEPFPPKMGRPSVERDPVPAILASKSVDAMIQVADSMRQQSIAIVGELHETAMTAITAVLAAGQQPGLDAVCCAVPFKDIHELMGVPEQAQLVKARNILRGSIPTAVNAGTHLWPIFEAPIPADVEPVVEEAVYFKLFLKYCYTGPQVGEAHEFSAGDVCRQCGLALGEPMDQIDFTKDGARILAAQEGRLRVEATTDAFFALSEAVRRRRMILGRVEISQEPWMTGLQALVAATSGPFAKALTESLEQIHDTMDEMERVQAWIPLATYMDELKHDIADRIGPLNPKTKAQATRAQEARVALDMLDTLTEDPFVEGPRALQEYWCAKVQAAGVGYTVTRVVGAPWEQLSRKHVDMMDKLVSDNALWYSGQLSSGAKAILKQVAPGRLLRVWIQMVRPGNSTAWTIQEAQMVLRTIVLESWRSAVVNGSLYATIASPAERETISAELANWTRALMFHAKQQYIRYSKETIKRILQDRAGLERDTIVEEFESIKDDDLRAAELLKKQFRIGRWAGGANLQKYDADTFEFENEQRKRMGIMDPPVEQIVLGKPVQDYGLALAGGPEDGYDVNQGADGDDY